MSRQGKSIGVVLRTRNYREKDLWVSILTAETGRNEFLAKSVRSLTSRRRSALQTGSLVRVSWVGVGETRLITEAIQEESLLPRSFSLATMRDVSAVLEMLFYIALEEQSQPELYAQGTQLLRYLRDNEDEAHRGYIRQQLLELLTAQGIEVPQQERAQSAVEVYEAVVGRKVKSFTFLKV